MYSYMYVEQIQLVLKDVAHTIHDVYIYSMIIKSCITVNVHDCTVYVYSAPVLTHFNVTYM